jgi:hypothetical protein
MEHEGAGTVPVKFGEPAANRKAVLTVVAAIGLALIVLSFWFAWVSTVATVLLLCVTFAYVLLTHDTLHLAREQFGLLQSQQERQDRVLLFLDLTFAAPSLELHVFNLGLSSFLVQKIVARTSDAIDSPQTYDLHKIVESGKTETIKLPEDLSDEEEFFKDFEITVYYTGIKSSGSTPPKNFNVFSSSENPHVSIADGLEGPWIARCSKCEDSRVIDVRDVKTFDVADARRKQAEEDMALSCPQHKSDWLLTKRKFEAAMKARENRRKL